MKTKNEQDQTPKQGIFFQLYQVGGVLATILKRNEPNLARAQRGQSIFF
jgi:hypothetical protein